MGLIEDVTRAYIYSYNEAMKEYKNPNMAMNVATGVAFSIATAECSQQKQVQINPMDLIMAAVAKSVQEQASEEDEDEEA